MRDPFSKLNIKLARPLTLGSRVAVFVAAFLIPLTFLAPLWHMHFRAQQYPEGLDLYIYSHALVGGDDGNDLTEINVLNHYIGMRELLPEDFNELKWVPLILGGLMLLTLRAGLMGTLGSVLDIFVLTAYFGLFSLWSFWYKLRVYGTELDPKAAVLVEPFTPPMFGYQLVGQFDVWSYPAASSWLLFTFTFLLVVAMVLTWRRKDVSVPSTD